ncbi:GAF domain-containing protein [Stenomitos frigidus]|uniref:GAF domain-containing protein n=1 Tax=Stenomitos frigidus TaxID=1886765 RepID=UPI001C63570E|nr:GAF domain-containing protein [Stenomitos frigidus]
MHISEPSTMPLSEHEEAVTRTNGPERQSPDRVALAMDNQQHIAAGPMGAQNEPDPSAWWHYFQRSSQLLMAIIEPMTLTLQYANDFFCRMVGVTTGTQGDLAQLLQQRLSEADNTAIQRLYCRHLLHRVLEQFYQFNPQGCRLLEEPIMVSLQSPLYPELRYVEFWLRSDQLTITRLNPQLDEFADLGLERMAVEAIAATLNDPEQFESLAQRLRLDNYQVDGWLLLEGLDITEREIVRRITHLLIDRDSILRPQKFGELNQQMRSLFRAQNTLVLSIEADQIRLFMGSLSEEPHTTLYPLKSLQQSHFMRAIRTNQVLTVPDLAADPRTDAGRQLVAIGVRSLLLIPLLAPRVVVGDTAIQASIGRDAQEGEQERDTNTQAHEHTETHAASDSQSIADPTATALDAVGVVALLSDRPHSFDAIDCRHAEQLIPAYTRALTAAQRQLVQQRFITNIHPAVEWRFLQEAERRGLGLPPEPIVFTNVYPLYGISDIRGSSDERNRAIQADLLEQFHLGLAAVDAACQTRETSLGRQLHLDLVEHIRQMQECVTVDAEVSRLRYLHDHLELYFDYFAQCGDAAITAVSAYRAACENEHGCVYRARAHYDELIRQINALLRETWDRWQSAMQQTTPHYCDIEATDGIDHMIYAGASIDPKFGSFQLRSLRYEQLCAVCDCARTAFHLQEKYSTHMQVTHLVLVQDTAVDIFHDETTERLFDVRGSRDTRYEIVKKRIDKAVDEETGTRITQPGMLTLVFCTEEERTEYQQYLRYLMREGWVDAEVDRGTVQPLQGVTGLKYARVRILPEKAELAQT